MKRRYPRVTQCDPKNNLAPGKIAWFRRVALPLPPLFSFSQSPHSEDWVGASGGGGRGVCGAVWILGAGFAGSRVKDGEGGRGGRDGVNGP